MIALLASGTAAAGQVRDTLAQRDTLVAADTSAIAQDTLPPPVFISFPELPRGGWSDGVWTWDRVALSRETAISLLDLLSRVPGVLPLRSGVFLQPEAASAFGTGGTRTIVELDGYRLDPLAGEAVDLSTIALASLASVRIDRRMDILHIRLRTLEPTEPEPLSRIEAGLGEPNANLFRGTLLIPRFISGPFGFTVERSEFEGAGIRQPATGSALWLKWARIGASWGVQAEWRANDIDRDQGSPIPLSRERRDLILRARAQLAESVIGELAAGRSTDSERELNTAIPDSLRRVIERSSTQATARVAWARETAFLEGSLRYRDGDGLPRLEAGVEAGASLPGGVAVAADAHHARWRGDTDATAMRLHAAYSPVSVLRVFGEWTRGEQGGPAYRDTIADATRIFDRTAYRAGAETSLLGVRGGAAFLRVEADSVTTLGLPPDSVAPVGRGGAVTGWEAWGRVPLLGNWLAAAGSYTSWVSGSRWAYLPVTQWRAALEVHAVPLPSGNLEIAAWGEALFRGAMQPPAAGRDIPPDLPGRTVLNAHLAIRIIDVHIFVRFDDLLPTDPEDVPGLPVRGPRVFYGVKWDFRN